MIKRILVGTPATGRAGAAVETATRLAGTFDAELVVLRLEPAVDARQVFDPDGVPEEPETPAPSADQPVRVRSRLARGNPVRAVCEAAVREHADLIVMPHGRAGGGRILPLRASRALVERAPCPVLLVAS